MKKFDLQKYKNGELADLAAACLREIRQRRITQAEDPGSEIAGLEGAKRGLLVASVQKMPVLFFGSAGSGKSLMASLASHMDCVAGEIRLCPCGGCGDGRLPCKCRPAELRRHARRVQDREKLYQMHVECSVEAYNRDSRQSRTSLKQLLEMSQAARGIVDSVGDGLDDASSRLLRQAVNAFGWNPGDRRTAIEIARSVAALDRQTTIQAHHLAESVQYRKLGAYR